AGFSVAKYSRVVPVQQATNASKNRPFLACVTAPLRRRGVDAASHAAERKRLQPYPARSSQRREKQTFAAEECRLDFLDVLNVVLDGRLKSHNAAGIDAQQFTRTQIAFENRASGMDKGQTI